MLVDQMVLDDRPNVIVDWEVPAQMWSVVELRLHGTSSTIADLVWQCTLLRLVVDASISTESQECGFCLANIALILLLLLAIVTKLLPEKRAFFQGTAQQQPESIYNTRPALSGLA